jgi:hypothetical protein
MKLIHEDVVIEQVLGVLDPILASLGGSNLFLLLFKPLMGRENVI